MKKVKGDYLSDDFYPAVKKTIENILDKKNNEIYKCDFNLNRKAYYKEQATLKLSLPRGSGNTNIAERILKDFPESNLIVYTMLMGDFIVKDIKKDIGTNVKKRIFSKNNFRVGMAGRDMKIVIVDASVLFSNSFFEELYNHVLADCFVFLE